MSAALPPFRAVNITFCGQIKKAYLVKMDVGPDRRVAPACFKEARDQVNNVTHTVDKDGKPCSKEITSPVQDMDTDTYEYGLFSFRCPCDAVHMIATPFDP